MKAFAFGLKVKVDFLGAGTSTPAGLTDGPPTVVLGGGGGGELATLNLSGEGRFIVRI